jgi:hypothetical protein
MFAIKVETPNFPQETLFDLVVNNRRDIRYLDGSKDKLAQYITLTPCKLEHW